MEISVIQGDITKQKVDIIVNAANSSLLGGGGVDGAIHRAGGSAILEECRRIRETHGECAAGDAVITTAGKLPAKYLIHTVGPVWHGGTHGEKDLLKSCYLKSLALAGEHGASTIAFPNISTGVYHYPKDLALDAVLEAVGEFQAAPSSIRHIIFVTFDEENFALYSSAFPVS